MRCINIHRYSEQSLLWYATLIFLVFYHVSTDCPTNCTTCSSQHACTGCNDGEYLTSTALCSQCDSPCSTCSSSSSFCSGCIANYFLEPVSGVCYENSCPPTYYLNESNLCTLCDSSCGSCEGPTETNCTTCLDAINYTLNDGTCTRTCPSGTYLLDDKSGCGDCIPGCSVCSNSSKCEVCMDPLVQVLGSCVGGCFDGYYESEGTCKGKAPYLHPSFELLCSL